MSWLRRVVARVRVDDRGSGYLAAFIVLFAVLTFGGVGVLVDSARIVAAERHASASAFEAARAGAQAINVSSGRGGVAVLDPTAATAAASAAAAGLLAGSGASLEGVSVSGDEVVVTVRRRVEPWFPLVSARTITETGRARLAVGITAEGQ